MSGARCAPRRPRIIGLDTAAESGYTADLCADPRHAEIARRVEAARDLAASAIGAKRR